MKDKTYRYDNVLVKHVYTGISSDFFEVLENKDNISMDKIAEILIEDWYEKGKGDYRVDGNTIQIIENEFYLGMGGW